MFSLIKFITFLSLILGIIFLGSFYCSLDISEKNHMKMEVIRYLDGAKVKEFDPALTAKMKDRFVEQKDGILLYIKNALKSLILKTMTLDDLKNNEGFNLENSKP